MHAGRSDDPPRTPPSTSRSTIIGPCSGEVLEALAMERTGFGYSGDLGAGEPRIRDLDLAPPPPERGPSGGQDVLRPVG